MARKEKDQWGGFLFGPIIVLGALAALWKNEVRFDYYRAASKTTPVDVINDQADNQLISHTGEIDKSLTINGGYVTSFVGYLVVNRNAEIYCWDRSEDSEGDVTWSKGWYSGVDNNSRNSGIRQRLDSKKFLPSNYRVGNLTVTANQIDFVDSRISISPAKLKRREQGHASAMSVQGNYFYLAGGPAGQLGDERVSYHGIPVPDTTTFFGKLTNGQGVAYDDEKREGMISAVIQDSGVLHYLVAGDRDTALNTMKQHIAQLKWIVRAIGTAVTVLGFVFLFGSMARFLYGIPVVGWMAEQGVIILSLLLGIPLAILTILCGYLAGHPVLLAGLVALVVGVLVYLLTAKRKAKVTQKAVRKELNKKHGRKLESTDIKTLEFIELVHLANSDSDIDTAERDFLYRWGKKNGWKREKCDKLVQQAQSERQSPEFDKSSNAHLQSLIELALADGVLSPYEIRTIRKTATLVGYDRPTVDELMNHVRENAMNQQQA